MRLLAKLADWAPLFGRASDDPNPASEPRPELPPELDPIVYRNVHADLAAFDDNALLEHYRLFGREEGRQANNLRDRGDFVGMIPGDASILEIGPFYSPVCRRPGVHYFDVLTQDQLHQRAKNIGVADADPPFIHYVSPVGDLGIVNDHFDVVVSSHCIEHQPDLVRHLNQVGRLLRPGGAYFVLVPDKRYCFDHFMAPSTIAQMLDAAEERRTVHGLRNVIEHRALSTHNESLRHWQGDHGVELENGTARIEAAEQEYAAAAGGYIDVHAWYFTPDSLRSIVTMLQALGKIGLDLERLYPTRYGSNEFWFIMRKADQAPGATTARQAG